MASKIKTVSESLPGGGVAEFYAKSYPGQGVVCYWSARLSCGCRVSGRADTSAAAFTLAAENEAAHVHA